MAHRAVHNHWIPDSYDPVTGCEARHIASFRTTYIENTIPSIRAAFSYGATIVEIDIRHTADNHLVVFHDDDLSCRTDGTGLVNERSRTCSRWMSDMGTPPTVGRASRCAEPVSG